MFRSADVPADVQKAITDWHVSLSSEDRELMPRDDTITVARENTGKSGAEIVRTLQHLLSKLKNILDPEKTLGLSPRVEDDEKFKQSREQIVGQLWEEFPHVSDNSKDFLLATVQTIHAKNRIISGKESFPPRYGEDFKQHVQRIIVNDMYAIVFPLRIDAMTFKENGVLIDATPMAIEQLTEELRVQPELIQRDKGVLYSFTFSEPKSREEINTRIDYSRYILPKDGMPEVSS